MKDTSKKDTILIEDLVWGYTTSIFKNSIIAEISINDENMAQVVYKQNRKQIKYYVNINDVANVEMPIWEKCGRLSANLYNKCIKDTDNEKS